MFILPRTDGALFWTPATKAPTGSNGPYTSEQLHAMNDAFVAAVELFGEEAATAPAAIAANSASTTTAAGRTIARICASSAEEGPGPKLGLGRGWCKHLNRSPNLYCLIQPAICPLTHIKPVPGSTRCGVSIPSRSRVASHQPWGRALYAPDEAVRT
jgi:hypothetical protein